MTEYSKYIEANIMFIIGSKEVINKPIGCW